MGIKESVARFVAKRQMHVHAITRPIGKWLGHKRTDQAHFVCDLSGRHLEEDELVARGQGIAIGVVDLKLSVRVFMVDLIDVKPTRAQSVGESL